MQIYLGIHVIGLNCMQHADFEGHLIVLAWGTAHSGSGYVWQQLMLVPNRLLFGCTTQPGSASAQRQGMRQLRRLAGVRMQVYCTLPKLGSKSSSIMCNVGQ